MKRILIILFLLSFLYSCTQKPSCSDLLTGSSFKYWYVVRNHDARDKSMYFDYFDTSGKWLVFVRHAGDNSFEKLDRGDVFFIETWKLLTDSTIDIGTRPYRILKLTNDEFIFRFQDSIELYTEYSVAAPDSLIPPEFRKFQ